MVKMKGWATGLGPSLAVLMAKRWPVAGVIA